MAFKRKEYHKEENCLNCSYPLVGKYCGNCGQKAFLHKDSFLHMVAHFAGDYFHYDNKFWITMKTLFTKPGVATLEYNEGKRAKYLNPIQLYIFVTTVFFIFAMSDSPKTKPVKENTINIQQKDTSSPDVNAVIGISKKKDGKARFGIGSLTPREETVEAYDSVQKSLPPHERDGIFLSHVRHKSYVHGDSFGDLISNNFPKVFFILLPIFAALLALLFRRKKLYYVDHLIFSIHFHSVLFAILILNLLLINLWQNDAFDEVLTYVVFTGVTFYLFLAIKKVYPSPAWKIIFKLMLLLLAYLISFLIVFLLLLAIIYLFF